MTKPSKYESMYYLVCPNELVIEAVQGYNGRWKAQPILQHVSGEVRSTMTLLPGSYGAKTAEAAIADAARMTKAHLKELIKELDKVIGKQLSHDELFASSQRCLCDAHRGLCPVHDEQKDEDW